MLPNNLSTFSIGNRLRLWECLLRNVVTLAFADVFKTQWWDSEI